MNKDAALLLFLCAGFLPAAIAQEPSALADEDERTTAGTVVSSTNNTITLRTERNRHELFVIDRETHRPRSIPNGASVRLVSVATGERGARLARIITVSGTPSAGNSRPGGAQEGADAIPPTVRRLERDIERAAKRFGLGVRAGAALDPELILVGVHANMGTLFTRNISFRPNVEFAFGEVTNLFALNLEALYRLPISPRAGRLSAYLGAGPSFAFSSQNFERAARGESRDIDFDDFDFNAGFNILTGVQFRGGMFVEAKTSVYASPHFRMIVGYNF